MTRFLSTLAVLAIAVVAGIISYNHIAALALANGYSGIDAQLLPVAVDGTIVAASMVLLDYARRGVPAPALGRILLGAGIGSTILANAVSGLPHGMVGVGVAMLPALLFTGSVELLIGMVRGRAAPESADEKALFSPASNSRSSAPAHEGGPATAPKIHKPLPANRPTSRGMSPSPAEVFRAELAAGKVPGIRAIKQQCRVGQDRAVEIRDQLAAMIKAHVPAPAEIA